MLKSLLVVFVLGLLFLSVSAGMATTRDALFDDDDDAVLQGAAAQSHVSAVTLGENGKWVDAESGEELERVRTTNVKYNFFCLSLPSLRSDDVAQPLQT